MPDREHEPRRKKATQAGPVRRNWHPDHVKPVRATFISERHTNRMWKL